MTDLTQFKQHILLFLQHKNVEPPTIERVGQLMNTMDDSHLFLFCEFSFILKRRECDPAKKTGEHAIRDYLQTFWHDENRLVKDLRYADYIHYFTKYHRCGELFDFFKLCTEHGNRKRPLSFTVKLQEFMATPIETLRSRSDRKSKITGKKLIPSTRVTGVKRIKQEDTIPCDLQYTPSNKKARVDFPVIPIKTEPVYNPTPVDLFATDFTYEEQWSPQSQDSDVYSSQSSPHSSPMSSQSSPHSSPMSSPTHSPTPTYPELETYPSYSYSTVSAAPPQWSRVPSLSNNTELCASDVDWDAIAQDLNKTYAPIVEATYSYQHPPQPTYQHQQAYPQHYSQQQAYGWYCHSSTSSY